MIHHGESRIRVKLEMGAVVNTTDASASEADNLEIMPVASLLGMISLRRHPAQRLLAMPAAGCCCM